jgi:hypothetical protein
MLALFCARPARASITLVTNTFVDYYSSGTTPAVNTTGATLLVVAIGGASGSTVSDNKSNTWHSLTAYGNMQLFYAYSPTVGSGHTFSESSSSGALFVYAFSGTLTTSAVFDTQNGYNGGYGTSAQPGSITPAGSGDVLVTVQWPTSGITSPSINDGFSISNTSGSGGADAYLIDSASSAINPTWTWTGGSGTAMAIAAFKPAAGGAACQHALAMMGAGCS